MTELSNIEQGFSQSRVESTPEVYSWLLSEYSSPVWRFRPHIETDELSKYTVNWFDDVALESTDGWLYWVECAKEWVACRMSCLDRRSITTSSLVGYARSIRAFYYFLWSERFCSSLDDVTEADLEAYKGSLSDRDLVVNTVEGYLFVIAGLYSMRDILSQSLSFDPFPDSTIAQYAKSIAAKTCSHTVTLLPREIFFILNEALKRINDSHRTIRLYDIYLDMRQKYFRRVGNFNNCAERFRKRTNIAVSKLLDDVAELYGAAIIVTLLLTAERKHEASLRESDDVTLLLSEELDTLYGLEKKTSGSESGKRTEVAVIDEVKAAFDVIIKLTKRRRVESGKSKVLLKLPTSNHGSSGTPSHFLHSQGMYRLLNRFIKSIGLDVKVRPHMFRRAYSMLWAWRYEIGELDELSLMLKHNNKLFTVKYTDDEDIWEFMPEVEQKMAFDILNNAFLKKSKVCGGASKTLERYARLIQAKSRLLNPEAIAVFVDELINKDNIKIISHADGYCFITKDSKAQSKCLDEDGEPSELRREEKRCVECPNFACDDQRVAHWEKRIEMHQKVVDFSNNEKLVESSQSFIVHAGRMLGK